MGNDGGRITDQVYMDRVRQICNRVDVKLYGMLAVINLHQRKQGFRAEGSTIPSSAQLNLQAIIAKGVQGL